MSLEDSKGKRAPSLLPLLSRRVFRVAIFLIVIAALIFSSLFFLTRSTGKVSVPQKGVTPTPSPTATGTLVIATPVEALFYDTFQDNRHNWTLSKSGGFIRILLDGKIALSATRPNTTLVEGLPNFSRYTDFSLTINFVFNQGDRNDSIGVYVRGDTNLDHDYRVDINGDSTIDVAKEYLDKNSSPQSQLLDGPMRVAALHPAGQSNTLTAILQGPTMRVLINKTPVSEITDSAYPTGQIALFARHGATSPAVTASFSLFEIDRLAEPSPTPVA